MGRRLFVGNLPYSATESEVRTLFEERWPVVEVRIVLDRETGRSRGFGFVELDTDDAAQQAIEELHGGVLGGRNLAVREAHERQKRRFDERFEVPVESSRRPSSIPPPPRDREPRGGRYTDPRGPGDPPPPRSARPSYGPPPNPSDPDEGRGRRRRKSKKKKRRDDHDEDW